MSADRIAEACLVRPSARQVAWQSMEFYGFLHFGMNTMTDREWGAGTEDPTLFGPPDVDADQWVSVMKSAGMRGVILTCKHHDGFALWPTRVSTHSVASSPWRDGAGDLVSDVADACRRHGMRFGIYLSPWDKAEPSYGSGERYDDFFVAQLTELLTQYGEIFCVWLDGANGEGPNGRRQMYDWDRYYALIRRLQPGAVISVCGPDVRWCGNEAGAARPNEWSVVPATLRDAERTADRSQKDDNSRFRVTIRSDDLDLGSRQALTTTTSPLVWYPAEVNTSIRPGWFYHRREDHSVRTPEELLSIYLGSVGGNATFLLNVAPDQNGRIPEHDADVLSRLGRLIHRLDDDRVADAEITLSSSASYTPPETREIGKVGWRDRIGTWSPTSDDSRPTITLRWSTPQTISAIVLREDITHGQLLEHVTVHRSAADRTNPLPPISTASIGYQRILTFPPATVTAITITIEASRATPHLSMIKAIAS